MNTILILTTVYLIIGIIIATIWGVNNLSKYSDIEDYMMATFPVLVIIMFWIMFVPIILIWIINKLKKD